MSEQNFDFKSLDLSKESDQKKFDEEFGKLPEEEQEGIVGVTQGEATDIGTKAEKQEEIVLTSEQEKIKENIVARFTGLNVDVSLEKDRLLKNRKLLNLSEILIQSAIKEAVIKNLESGYINRAILIEDEFRLPKSGQIQLAVKRGLVNILCEGHNLEEQVSKYENTFPKLKEIFNLHEDFENFISSAIKKSIVESLNNEERLDFAIKIAEDFNLPDIIQSIEVQNAAEKSFINYFIEKGVGGLSDRIDDKDFYGATKIKNAFELPISDLEIKKIIEMAETLSVGTDKTLNEAFEIKIQVSSPLFSKVSQELIVDGI